MVFPEVLNRLIEELKKLPGIGSRTAERLALAISKYPVQEALQLSHAVRDVVERLKCCSVCFNSSEKDPCPICSDASRDKEKILVVEGPGDLNAFENAGWRGRYHVLQGLLDPVEGVRPEDLTVRALAERVKTEKAKEVIIATSPDFEGDGTALVIAREMKGSGVTVSRIARGIPTGSSIEYANRTILSDALEGRSTLS